MKGTSRRTFDKLIVGSCGFDHNVFCLKIKMTLGVFEDRFGWPSFPSPSPVSQDQGLVAFAGPFWYHFGA